MSNPQRQRPGSASGIKLTPQVEPVRTSTEIDERGTGKADEVFIPETAGSPTIPVASGPKDGKGGVTRTQSSLAERRVRVAVAQDPKLPTTVSIKQSLKKMGETAVLATSPYEGGYSSFSALIEGALQRELARLADEFNDGQEFEVNPGGFRQGRPPSR